jgi:hypothetical protein
VDVAEGDVDGDGQKDLFVLRWKRPGLMYRNNGDGTFVDVTERAGLKNVGGDGFSALFFDYDGDGRQDLLVTSHAPYELALECLLRPDLKRSKWTPRLFHNRGHGPFEEVTAQVGLDRSYGTVQAAAVDVDQDGWTDLVLANGGLEEYRLEPSVILRNLQGKSFMEYAHVPSFDAPMNARTTDRPSKKDPDPVSQMSWMVPRSVLPDGGCRRANDSAGTRAAKSCSPSATSFRVA